MEEDVNEFWATYKGDGVVYEVEGVRWDGLSSGRVTGAIASIDAAISDHAHEPGPALDALRMLSERIRSAVSAGQNEPGLLPFPWIEAEANGPLASAAKLAPLFLVTRYEGRCTEPLPGHVGYYVGSELRWLKLTDVVRRK